MSHWHDVMRSVARGDSDVTFRFLWPDGDYPEIIMEWPDGSEGLIYHLADYGWTFKAI